VVVKGSTVDDFSAKVAVIPTDADKARLPRMKITIQVMAPFHREALGETISGCSSVSMLALAELIN